MKFILGTKIGMTQFFKEDGTVVPVTRVQAGPCVITQVKTKDKDRVTSVQIGFGERKAFRVTKPEQGHLKDLTMVRFMRDFRVGEDSTLKRGDVFTLQIFKNGDKIQVVGTSKGKGFQGVVKRHGFHGQNRTHGHKDQERMPGSIGAGGVQRVFKGMRMAGHMGDARITVKNLEVIQVKPEEKELWIKGAVPGARHGLLLISSNDGEIEVEMPLKQIETDGEQIEQITDTTDHTVETVETVRNTVEIVGNKVETEEVKTEEVAVSDVEETKS